MVQIIEYIHYKRYKSIEEFLTIYRKRSLKVTCNIDGKIGILGSSKVTVKLTDTEDLLVV